jgi:hypothetical protein
MSDLVDTVEVLLSGHPFEVDVEEHIRRLLEEFRERADETMAHKLRLIGELEVVCRHGLGCAGFELFIEELWHTRSDEMQGMIRANFRRELVALGRDFSEVASGCGLTCAQLSLWCSRTQIKQVSVGKLLASITPLTLLYRTYHDHVRLSRWDEAQWEAWHARVRDCVHASTLAALCRELPLSYAMLAKVKRGLVPGDYFYRDYFTLRLLVDTLDPDSITGEDPMSHDTEDDVTGDETLPPRVPTAEDARALLTELRTHFGVDEVTILYDRGALRVWHGDVCLCVGEGSPARPGYG